MQKYFLYGFVALYLILFILSLFWGNNIFVTPVLKALNFFIVLTVISATYYAFKHEKILSPLFIFTLFFYFVVWIGFNFLFTDLASIGRIKMVHRDTYLAVYLVFVSGYVLFISGYLIGLLLTGISTTKIERDHSKSVNINVIYTIILLTITLKAFSQHFWDIGLAMTHPQSIPLSGVIFYVAKFTPLIGMCVLFTLGLNKKNPSLWIFLLISIFIYILLDVLAGWKSSPLILAFLFTIIYFSRKGLEGFNLRFLVVLGVIVLATLYLSSRVYRNRKEFKNNQLGEGSTVQLLEEDLVSGPEIARKLYLRLAEGVTGLCLVLDYYQKHNTLLSVENLFSQNPGAVRFITRNIYGHPDGEIVSRIASLWGTLFVYGRFPLVLVGFFILGLVSRMVFKFLHPRERDPFYLVLKAIFLFWVLQLIMGGLIYRGIKNIVAYTALWLMYYVVSRRCGRDENPVRVH